MIRTIQLLAIAIVAATACKSENRSASTNPVKWTVGDSITELRAESPATVRLAAAIDSGWYIYSLTQKAGGPTPMSVSVAPSPPFRVEGNAIGPQPVVIFDKEFGIDTERYEGTARFAVSVALTRVQPEPPPSLDIRVRYQACNESFCLPARTTVVSTRIRVTNRT